jgi:curved DNA-binding protein CbpA
MSSFAMRAASNAASCSFTAPFARARDVSRGSRLRARALSREDAERMYLTLGVSPGASPEAVKRAYKRLAKQLHPDVCADADADARFTAVCEAYNALANERGTLANVGTEAWRMKWAEQIRVMREVEAGATAVNVRRRRVARAATKTRQTRGAHDTDDHDDTDDTDDTDASRDAREHAAASGGVRRETIEERFSRAFEDDEKGFTKKKNAAEDASRNRAFAAEESAWQREQETRWAVRAQLGGLRDRERRRRRVVPPQKGKFVEPFADGGSRTAHDDEWNHSVQ